MHLQDPSAPADSPIKLSNPLWEQTLWPEQLPRTALDAAHCAKQPRLEGCFAEGQVVSPAAEPPTGAAKELELPTLAARIEGRPESSASSVDHTQLAADNSASQLTDAADQSAAYEERSIVGGASEEAVVDISQQQVQVVEQLNGAADIGDSDRLGEADCEAGPHVMNSIAMSISVEDVHADSQEQIVSSASVKDPASAEPVSGAPIKIEDSLANAMKPDIQSEQNDGSSKLGYTAEPQSAESPQQLKQASASSSSASTIKWPGADNQAVRPSSELSGLEDSAEPQAEPMNQLTAESTSSEAAEVQLLKDEEQGQKFASLREPQPGQYWDSEGSGEYLCAMDPGQLARAADGEAPAQLLYGLSLDGASHAVICPDRSKECQPSYRQDTRHQMHACLFDNVDLTAHEDGLSSMHAGSVQMQAEMDSEPHAAADLTIRGRFSGLQHPADEPGSVDQSSAAKASTAIPVVQHQAVAGHRPTSSDAGAAASAAAWAVDGSRSAASAMGQAGPIGGGTLDPTERSSEALRTMEILLFKGDRHRQQQLACTPCNRRSAGRLSLCPDLVLTGSVLVSVSLLMEREICRSWWRW